MDSPPAKVVTTITLAPALRDQLDAAAAAQERSRSWVCSKAIGEYLANPPAMTHEAFAETIRRDLASRAALAAPQFADILDVTAALAARLSSFTETIATAEGVSTDTLRYLSATRTLLHGLSLLGTANVADTLAEQIAVRAIDAGDALLGLVPTGDDA
jgi:predicted transcriptional regulator